jgi:proteic killer suppression protein
MAIMSFADQTTSDVFHSINSKASRRLPQRVWTAAKRRLELLHAAATTLDLGALPGLHFEPLKHTKPGYNSIRINDQYRIVFVFKDGNAYEVGIEDYHPHGSR